jgi:hypothetical protein
MEPKSGIFPAQGTSMELPSRERSVDPSRYTPSVVGVQSNSFGLGDSNEMDTSGDQPSPSTTTTQSRGGSTSHTSYSPAQQQDDTGMRFGASPKNLQHQIPLPQSTGAAGGNFFATSDDIFSAMYSQPGQLGNDGFMMNDWDMGTMGSGTGMTPMSEGGWNQMLESINMGWSDLGTPHGNVVTNPNDR